VTVTETASNEDLLRILVERTTANDAPPDAAAEEIVFDLQLDGDRYLLIKMPKPASAPAQLSPREKEIVRLVALGHSNKIIGDVLSISSWTVCTHLRRIFAKLGVGSRAAMVARLLQAGASHGRAKPEELVAVRDPSDVAEKQLSTSKMCGK
jgi:DNA-binding CsgD family transcriptional regulator